MHLLFCLRQRRIRRKRLQHFSAVGKCQGKSLPNPYYVEGLRSKTGLDPEVSGYVFGFDKTREYVEKLKQLISFSLPCYVEEGKTLLVIAIGCTGGHHRSVAVAHELAEYIRTLGYPVRENHRDMTRN